MKTIVLYSNDDYAVVYKPCGYLSEMKDDGTLNVPSDIHEILGVMPYTVHRLDRGTDGLMVYALKKSAAAEFSRLIADGGLKKRYRAVITPSSDLPEEGEMRDFLFFDRRRDKSFVVDGKRAGSKEAVLRYKLGESFEIKGKAVRAAYVELETGRTHQIRVQFASRQSPLAGDGKYGSRMNYGGPSLTSIYLSFMWKGKREEYRPEDYCLGDNVKNDNVNDCEINNE